VRIGKPNRAVEGYASATAKRTNPFGGKVRAAQPPFSTVVLADAGGSEGCRFSSLSPSGGERKRREGGENTHRDVVVGSSRRDAVDRHSRGHRRELRLLLAVATSGTENAEGGERVGG
jgi:hypothetical protein